MQRLKLSIPFSKKAEIFGKTLQQLAGNCQANGSIREERVFGQHYRSGS
jgi:hypothetical protein